MGEVVALAAGGAPAGVEAADDGSLTERAGLAEVEAMRRRLLRLAFDVHDGPMQDLIGMTWRLQSARERAMKEAEKGQLAALAGLFDDFAGDLGRVEKGLRSLMFSLEHNSASQGSLHVPVADTVAAFEEHASARVEVSITGDVGPRSDSQRIALERVLRESLSNIAKHANAEHVAITLKGNDESIVLEIRDDGCGFTPGETAAGSQHIGIRAMRERLRLLGGEFTVASRVGGPTVITARILKWPAAHNVRPAAGVLGG
jgi:signal transduction histidine kinase